MASPAISAASASPSGTVGTSGAAACRRTKRPPEAAATGASAPRGSPCPPSHPASGSSGSTRTGPAVSSARKDARGISSGSPGPSATRSCSRPTRLGRRTAGGGSGRCRLVPLCVRGQLLLRGQQRLDLLLQLRRLLRLLELRQDLRLGSGVALLAALDGVIVGADHEVAVGLALAGEGRRGVRGVDLDRGADAARLQPREHGVREVGLDLALRGGERAAGIA